MSWMSKKTGRPKDEEGHVRQDITLSRLICRLLEDVPNKSRYIEDLIFCDNLLSGKQGAHIMGLGPGSFYAKMLGERSRFRKIPEWVINELIRQVTGL